MFYLKEALRWMLLPFSDGDGEFEATPGTLKFKFLWWLYEEVQDDD